MQRLHYILSLAMLVSLVAAQDIKEQWQSPTTASLRLTGPVKSLLVEQAESDGKRYPLQRCSFDTNGNALECTDYDSQKHGVVTTRRIFHYDDSGKFVAYDTYDKYGGFDRPQRITFTFDAQGRRIEQVGVQASGKPGDRFTYEYGDANRLVKETWYSWLDQQSPTAVTQYTFDKDGHLTDKDHKDEHARNYWHIHNDYNRDGQLSKRTQSQGGMSDVTTVYDYDRQGRKISVTTTGVNPEFRCIGCPSDGRIIYAYNAAGLLEDEVQYDASGQVEKIVHHAPYGPEHPVTVDNEVATDSPNGVPRKGYTYDSHGNWTERIVNTMPQFNLHGSRTDTLMTFRTIEYY